jgi:CheY-like chemotaxis protein
MQKPGLGFSSPSSRPKGWEKEPGWACHDLWCGPAEQRLYRRRERARQGNGVRPACSPAHLTGRRTGRADIERAGERGTETVLIPKTTRHSDAFQHRAERVRLYHYEATDGEEAVALFRERSDAIAPVILDIVMPKKIGKEVYEDLRRIRPGSKALFISGHPADIIHDKGMLDRELPFLSKPIALQTLLRKVREVPGVRA